MEYTCRLYKNTGFNSVNIPDSPALLNQMSYIDVPALNLLQDYDLPEVSVRAFFDDIKDVDYCKIGNFYYAVQGPPIMTSGDTATLSLVFDGTVSAGGPAALEILDGVTNRVHVTDDSYGLYNSNDPYMAPAYDMDVVVDVSTGDFSGSSYTFIETTLDLITMGHYLDRGASSPAVTATSDSGKNVTYPLAKYIPGDIKTEYVSNLGGTPISLPDTEGQVLYWRGANESPTLSNGIDVARSLGIENSISAQFTIPAGMIVAPSTSTPIIGTLTGKYTNSNTSGVPFIYGTAKNNRVWYGSQTPYTLSSCAGSSMSANAEEIYNGAANPSVLTFSDPRREGKPYFRFNPLNGVNALAGGKHKECFRNCISGLTWRSVPMVFTSKSGSVLDQIRFKNSNDMSDLVLSQEHLNTGLTSIGSLFGMAGSQATLAAKGELNPVGLFSTAVEKGAAAGMSEHLYKQYKERVLAQRAIEMQEFQISQNVNVPDIRFALDPQLMADVLGNGFIVSRVVYKDADIARIDRILTAYGYKHSKVLQAGDFNNRLYFNYVEARVTVGNLPRWWADMISAQLSNGVRVWHVKPNHQYYNNNPVRT